jgi:hypothetical protein
LYIVEGIEYKSYLDYFTDVMERYFRKVPPIASHIYLSEEVMQDAELRKKIAAHCKYPHIINALANDSDKAVREAAKQNDYWLLVGNYSEISGFEKHERKEFARVEGHSNIIALLMFEEDPDIITEALGNPSISVKMIATFIKLLEERGKGRKDKQLLGLALSALKKKKERIVIISEINKAVTKLTDENNINLLLGHLLSSDHFIREVVIARLAAIDVALLKKFIYTALEKSRFKNNLENFIALQELFKLINERKDLEKVTTTTLKLPINKEGKRHFISAANFYRQLITKRRNLLIKKCAEDLTDFNNIILLSYCHIDEDKKLRRQAEAILTIDDIFNIIDDISTPRKAFKDVLQIFENHPDKEFRQRVEQVYLAETNRLKESLKELEQSVTAYFDIISQSLGYSQIHEFQDVIKAIDTTEKQISKFDDLLEKNIGRQRKELNKTFSKIKILLRKEADNIYLDTSQRAIHDMSYIQSLIHEIINLKEMGLSSLRQGTPEDIEMQILTKAKAIWQSALSVYLGRLKDLSEMLQKKLIKLASNTENEKQFKEELLEALEELELNHKEKINCKLQNPCKVCSRRGCSAERFLAETDFLINELLDNFVEE